MATAPDQTVQGLDDKRSLKGESLYLNLLSLVKAVNIRLECDENEGVRVLEKTLGR